MQPQLAVFYPNALITPSFVLTQLEQDVSPEYNFEEASYIAPGATFPGFTGLESKDPKVDSSTTQIRTVLDNMAFEGVSVGFTAASSMEFQQGKNLEGREPAADLVHTRVTASNSLFYWKSIKAGEKGFAKIDFSWNAVIDANGNPPLVTNNNVALTELPVVGELYRTGPVNLVIQLPDGAGGFTTETFNLCNDGWTWDNNIKIKQKKCGGLTAYSYAAVEMAEPKISIPTDNISQVLSLFEGGAIVSLDCYLRRALQGGENVDPGTAQHIKLSTIVGTAYPTNARTIMAMPHSFTVDTASIIPT